MSNKTISINPGLFSLGTSKTKKNRDKKKAPEIKPLISPNVLKNKLLKRIKEHKQRETENLENNKKKLVTNDNTEIKNKVDEISAYSDEFNDSLNYLQTLSKQKKINDEKVSYERKKQKQREEIERRTIRNYHNKNELGLQPVVNIDLPEELKQPLININTEHFVPNGESISIQSHIKDNVPYGILKGGTKPTYRDWSRTQKSYIVTNPNSALTIEGTINNQKSERENRLNYLREKLKKKQLEETKKKMKI
jgi:hypothetical protein